MSKKKKDSKSKDLLTNNIEPLVRKTNYPGIIVSGKNEGQKSAIKCIVNNTISFLYGIPGTGKTHLAVGMGLQKILSGKDGITRLILTRPYVEAGEHLGYLPGNYNNKIAPFMYPVMEIVSTYLGKDLTMELIDSGYISVIPLAYMRGVTLHNCFVVSDECQNASISQIRMLLTRIGENAKMVITGDTEQSDIRGTNGLADAIERLKDIDDLGFYKLTEESCVRSPLVAKIDSKYRK